MFNSKCNLSIVLSSLILASLIYGCEPDISICQDQRTDRYKQLFDNMHLDCPGDTTTAFLKAVVNGEELCYYEGLAERYFRFGISVKFTTPGPSFTTGDTTVSDLRRGARFTFLHLDDSRRHGEDYFVVEFPDFRFEMDSVAYLDSILAIEMHDIGSSREDKWKFKILLRLMHIITTKNGQAPSSYNISSTFGDQTDSYLKVVSVVKRKIYNYVEYDVEFEFQCKLYHDPQYCYKYGLWSEVKDGRFKGTLRVRG